MKPLNLFYQEPDPDRWLKYDHYPRRLIRRIIRGKQRPGGVQLVAINLLKGLDRLGIPYRFNDFNYAKKHPEEFACIIGKPQLLFEKKWNNPIIFGAGVFSHPTDAINIFNEYPNLKQVLVPGEWMKGMFNQYYGDRVTAWAVGIDTDEWKPGKRIEENRVLIYDKIRWEYQKYERLLLKPLIRFLEERHIAYDRIRYGSYEPQELKQQLNRSASVIFLCEHETQGLAYQQFLASGKPVFAWDRGGYWQDPSYFPDKVQYGPVSSVPYWDDRCGMKFKDLNEFYSGFEIFRNKCSNSAFNPRAYIMEKLTLEKCAFDYLNIVNEIISRNQNADKDSL